MVQIADSLSNTFKLIIQPYNSEDNQLLYSLGFERVPSIPQLLYLAIDDHQVTEICLKLSHLLSEASQIFSRCFFTRSPLEANYLLVEFLNGQSLSAFTNSARDSWFFKVLINQAIFFKYQPIFSFASGEIYAYECLVRASDESGRYFAGKQLIDAALSTKCVYEFDELARKTCLDGIAAFKDKHTFFINISPNAIIHNPQSLEQNYQQILELGLTPQQIVIELTEVEALVNFPELTRLLSLLRSQGFRIAVDDLCSNVAFDHYFTGFCPDVIKLDRQLIHGCSHHSLQQVLIRSLLHSAHELGILVVAEGLEDVEDIDFCRSIGIDFAQGYGLAMPEATLQKFCLTELLKPAFPVSG